MDKNESIRELEELLKRVEIAITLDYELDAEVWLAVVPGASRRNVMQEFPDEPIIWEYSDPERNLIGRSLVPNLTSSIDAAVRLVDRICPVNSLRLWSDPSGCSANLTWWPDSLSGGSRVQRSGISEGLPLAIITALLKALIAQKKK